MKLAIQIPCFNEAQTLALVLSEIPKQIAGIDSIEVIVLDDGSTDDTCAVAAAHGVSHILKVSSRNRGWLGRAFRRGAEFALDLGADILVNTDGDNQYPGKAIPDLVEPLIKKRARLVIGNRYANGSAHAGPVKEFLNSLGNRVATYLSGEPIFDCVSGFRAYSRSALLELNIVSLRTYTLDSIVQAVKKGIEIEWVPVTVNPPTRSSRLFRNTISAAKVTAIDLLMLFLVYEPFRFFLWLCSLTLIPGAFLLARFLYFYFLVPDEARGHIQSVIAGGVLCVIGVQFFAVGIISSLQAYNRRLLESALHELKQARTGGSNTF